MANTLHELLINEIGRPLVLVDVGAAGGAIDGWKLLGDKAQVFCFEARDDEAEQLSSGNDQSNIEYVPFALSEDDKGINLNITAIPTCSSSYPPIRKLYEAYPGCAIMRPVETVACRSVSLDAFMQSRGINRIHGIKLDTQGAELNILRGAKKALEQCLFAIVEVEFNALYEGQPLFCDVDRFMRDQGFVLWRLNNLAHYSTGVIESDQHPMMIGSDPGGHQMIHFANGQIFWGDALYVKASGTSLSDLSLSREDAIAGAILVAQWRFWDLALEFIRKSGDAHLLGEARRLLGVEFVEDVPGDLPPSSFQTQVAVVKDETGWRFDFGDNILNRCILYGPYLRLPEGKLEVTFHVAAAGLDGKPLESPIVFDIAQDETRQTEAILVGPEGTARIETGEVSLPFTNGSAKSRFEFRIYTHDTPFSGSLLFKGVSVRRIED